MTLRITKTCALGVALAITLAASESAAQAGGTISSGVRMQKDRGGAMEGTSRRATSDTMSADSATRRRMNRDMTRGTTRDTTRMMRDTTRMMRDTTRMMRDTTRDTTGTPRDTTGTPRDTTSRRPASGTTGATGTTGTTGNRPPTTGRPLL
jgi:hypothetical protein